MTGPWDDYTSSGEAGPWTDFASKAVEMAVPGIALAKALPHLAMGAAEAPMALAQILSRIPGQRSFSPPEEMDKGIARIKQAYRQEFSPDTTPGSSLAQGVGAAIGPGLVAGKLLGPAASIVGRATQGAGIGAVQGALTPTTGEGDFLSEKMGQAGKGAAIGGGASLGLDTLGRVIAPKVSGAVKQMMDSDIGMTIGQRMGGLAKSVEDKLTSVPVLGDLIKWNRSGGLDDFNRAIYNKVLEPIGQKFEGEIGQKGIAAVQNKVSGAYDAVLAKSVPATPSADEAFVQGMNMVSRMVPQDKRATFVDSVTQQFSSKLTPAGTLTPSSLKAMDSEFGRLGRQYSGSAIASERELGYAYQQAAREVREMYARANPGLKPEMDAANSAYVNLVQLENAARGVKTARNEGVITPADYLKGIQKGDTSVRDHRFSAGEMRNQQFAQAADQVLPSKYPDSGSIGRLLAGAGLTGGLGYVSPAGLAATGLATLPYLPGTRALFSANRPEAVRRAGERLQDLIPYLAPAATGGLLGQ